MLGKANTQVACSYYTTKQSYAQTQKIDRYAVAFVHSDYDFAPVIFETSGALNKEEDCPQADYSIPEREAMPPVLGLGSLAVQAASFRSANS